MAVSKENKKHYRNIGHQLKPVVIVGGKGLSEGVSNEISRALDDHELIKIKLEIDDRDSRAALRDEICDQLNAELIQSIGKTILLFRLAKTPKLKTSNIR